MEKLKLNYKASLVWAGEKFSPSAPIPPESKGLTMAKKYAGYHIGPAGEVSGFGNKKEFKAATDALAEDTEVVAVGSANDLEQFSVSSLLALHNKLRPDAAVSKFKSKAVAIETVYPVLAEAANGGAPAAAAAPAAAPKKKAAAAPGNGKRRGRDPSFAANLRITRNQKDNPRRAGTHGFRAWDLIKDGMTVEQYNEAVKAAKIPGGLKHLQYDEKRNRVSVG